MKKLGKISYDKTFDQTKLWLDLPLPFLKVKLRKCPNRTKEQENERICRILSKKYCK